jgi:hypothetical protein
MLHPDRTHGVKAIDSEENLVEVMTNHKWPLCTGFEFDDFLYLNDGEKEGDPEYAAVKIDEVDGLMVSGREAGRIRPLGADASLARRFIHDMHDGNWTTNSPLKIRAEPDWHHSCELCEFKED